VAILPTRALAFPIVTPLNCGHSANQHHSARLQRIVAHDSAGLTMEAGPQRGGFALAKDDSW